MKKTKGFLLFEVLIAIVVASSVLVIIMQGIGSALRASSVSKNYFKAKLLAESKIEYLGKDIAWEDSTSSGRFTDEEDPEGIFSWEQIIGKLDSGMSGDIDLPISEAKVIVKWGNREVILVTYVTRYEESGIER